ncbi:MAG: hypothetical protein V2A66_11345 [Pseudomonadota bacterium]
MRLFITLIAAAAIAAPGFAFAQGGGAKKSAANKTVNEYGENLVPGNVVEQVAPPKAAAPKKAKAVEEKNVGAATAKPPAEPKAKKSSYIPDVLRPAHDATAAGRAKRFRVGVVGPGLEVASQGVGAMMTLGAEGEYFFFEKLSAGLRVETATKFKNTTILSFVPRVRYFFDSDKYPRWSTYVQAGIGVATYFWNGTHAAADIAIPGGGISWQWTDHFSVGADASLHIYVRDSTAVGFTLAPTFRYLF